jgi:hypothetical protein
MPTQLTPEQDKEARIFLARRAGERVITSDDDGVGVRRAHEMINLSEMSDRKFLEFLQCRDTLNNSLSLMDKDEYMEIPASARQYADNLAFEKVIEDNILNHKEDLDEWPDLTAQFVSNEIVKGLKTEGFTAKSGDGESVTVGKIRSEMTGILRDHNRTDTLEESIDKIKQSFSELGLSFIKPENHQAPVVEPEPEPEPEIQVKPEVAPPIKQEVPTPEQKDDLTFVAVPNNRVNNVIINTIVSTSLRATEDMPLNERSEHLATALAEIDVYYTADLAIIGNMPKDELIEESAANIFTPLEEVEFNSSLDDNDPTFRKMAVKLAAAMRDEQIMPAIDKTSPKANSLDLTFDLPKQAKKAEVESPTQITHMPRQRY